MALYKSFPPHRRHSSRPIDPSEALILLSSYLEAASTDAYLQPNALLTEGGPVSAISGPNAGLTLHNLKRVEAGLLGEHLSADVTFAKSADGFFPDLQTDRHEGETSTNTPGSSKKNGYKIDSKLGVDGWQDKLDFELEQDVTQGEVGDRLHAMTEVPEEDVEVPRIQATRSSGDKEERKQRKRERRHAVKPKVAAGNKEAGSKAKIGS